MVLGQSYDCPSASEVTLKDVGKVNQYQNHNKTQQSTNQVQDSWYKL